MEESNGHLLYQKLSENTEQTQKMLTELNELTQRLNGQSDIFKWIVTGVVAGVISLALLFFSSLLEVKEQISQSKTGCR